MICKNKSTYLFCEDISVSSAALPGSGCPWLWLTVEVFSPHAEITLSWQTGLVTPNRHKRRKTWNDNISNLGAVTVTGAENEMLICLYNLCLGVREDKTDYPLPSSVRIVSR